jgi:hypothetical protein
MSTFRKFWETVPRMDFVEYVNDFVLAGSYLATDWTITALQGTNTIAVDTDDAGGVLRLTTGGTENDGSGYNQKIEAWKFAAGKKLEFETRLKVNDADQVDFVVGLQITDTTPFGVSDGVWFGTDDEDVLVDFHAAKGSVQKDVAGIASLADDTWIKLGFYYDGGNTIDYYVNDVRAGSVLFDTYGPTTELCISLALTTGEATANTMDIDYIAVRMQR